MTACVLFNDFIDTIKILDCFLVCFAKVCCHFSDYNSRNQFSTAKLWLSVSRTS